MNILLKNRWLIVELDPQSGNLASLADAAGTAVVLGCWCAYTRNGQVVHENPAVKAERFAVKSVRPVSGGVESVIANDDIEILRRFELPADSPLLKVHYEVRALRSGVELARPLALPEIVFAADFVNQFEDEQDLYFDGEELGDGRELPPWRVFFREGHTAGLLAATRSKREMSRFQIQDRSFAIKPHILAAYTTDYVRTGSSLKFPGGPAVGASPAGLAGCSVQPPEPKDVYQADFEIGPWRQAEHAEILRAAGLNEPSDRRNPPLTGAPPRELKGLVFRGVDFAPASAVSAGYDPEKWMVAAMPHCTGGRALFCGCTVKTPPITLSPKLSGVYRVFAGIAQGNGVVAQFSADPMPTIRLPPFSPEGQDAFPEMNPFILRLSGGMRGRELYLKTARMDGQSVTFSRFANSYAATVLDYVRFERLTEQEAAAWEAAERAEPAIALSGFNDIPDIAWMVNAADPDPAAFEANLWEHANCKVRKVYWRIDGQCCDYPSKVNTMRYISAKVHGNYSPVAKGYGRVLKKTDMLKLAVEAARKYDLKLYGWMRFNNYSGNVQSDFFVRHPELREANDKGWAQSSLCLAHEAVRRHKIDILAEAAAYGLDGVNLGFLRHPPVLKYASILVEGFRAKYGVAPPPDPAKEVADHVQTHPEEDELRLKWYQYRAGFLTQFGRELRAALKQKGLGAVKVSIWVRHDRCLYDGIDIDAWLEEGLCDEVVASSGIHGDTANVSPEWRRKVQAKVPLIGGISNFNLEGARAWAPIAMREGFDGLCTYESDFSVMSDGFIDFYRSLRG
jgi:hypothetical protein